MQLIEHYEVPSGGVSSIVFMNVGDIPADYTDLVLKVSARSTTSNEDITVTLNTSGGTYSSRRLIGTGSSTTSDNTFTQQLLRATSSSDTASTFSNGELYIPNYRSSVAKSLSADSVSENNGTRAIQMLAAGLWTGTDPIIKITLTISGASFAQYSSASLYGITAGSDGTTVVS